MTQRLRQEPSSASSDALFDLLAKAHEGLDGIASGHLNSMVILLLANHIGSIEVVRDAVEAARYLLEQKSKGLPVL